MVWVPIPFASQRPWAAALFCSLIFFLGILYCLGVCFKLIRLPWHTLVCAKLPLFILYILPIWVLLQNIPLPAFLLNFISPTVLEYNTGSYWLPLSLDTYSSRLYGLKSLAYAIGFSLSLLLVTSHKRLNIVLHTVLFSGLLQALYGLFMVLSGLEYGFLVEKYVGVGNATGTFVNSNHFGAYMVICLSIGVGLLLGHRQSSPMFLGGFNLSKSFEYILSAKTSLRVALAVMVVALLLSSSRSANGIFIIALVTTIACSMLISKRWSWPLLIFGALFIVVDIVVLGQWFGFYDVAERLVSTDLNTEDRGSIALMVLSMLRDFPLTGVGGGAFDMVFSTYKTATFDLRYEHAHNDFLQLMVELGIPVFLLMVLFVLLTLKKVLTSLRTNQSTIKRAVAFSALMATVWMLLHSLTDFNLQITANAFTFVILMSLVWCSSSMNDQKTLKNLR